MGRREWNLGSKQVIGCLIAEHELEEYDWATLLARVSYIRNIIPSVNTGHTPYRVMFWTDHRPIFAAGLEPPL